MKPSILILLAALCASQASARTWHVLNDGSGDAPTVQAGIDSAAVGDTVLVGPGTYLENVNFNGKDIVLKSELGPAVTTIDGSNRNTSVVMFHNAETKAAVLEGFTITGGQGTIDFSSSPRGGGIVCLNASPVIRGNRLVGNVARLGGGISVGTGLFQTPRPAPLIEGNLFEENSASRLGAGLSAEHADVTIRNNVFRRNSSGFDGGGIWSTFAEGHLVLESNEFWENTAGDHGGGIHVADIGTSIAMVITGNLFVRNSADGVGTGDSGSGGAIYVFGITGTIMNNTMVWNQGFGESIFSGGGLILKQTQVDLEVRGNLIAFNEGGGIVCRLMPQTDVGANLLWQNTPEDLEPVCPADWLARQIFADPLFCGLAVDNYTLASDSPGLTGGETMGAFSEPGCGPVPVHPTTWGRIKAKYRSGP